MVKLTLLIRTFQTVVITTADVHLYVPTEHAYLHNVSVLEVGRQ